jgi:anti-sigma B factor antagonist
MLADLRFEQANSVVVARLAGDVDMSNARDVGSALDRAITNDKLALIIDLTDVDYFDSAGIHLVFDLRERLRVRGLQLRLVVPDGSTARSSLDLAGVLRAIDVDQALDAALAAIEPDPVDDPA